MQYIRFPNEISNTTTLNLIVIGKDHCLPLTASKVFTLELLVDSYVIVNLKILTWIQLHKLLIMLFYVLQISEI